MPNPSYQKEHGNDDGLGFWNCRNFPVMRYKRVSDEAISEVAKERNLLQLDFAKSF
jgi:hypothetical protein